ncbi:hypothetical protein HOD19_03420 [bacterium]|jgi:hypothetical protein|nr:hypothetical protein [bacterium]MBT4648727.1 hypothetical protein [bacterium]
MNSTERKDLQKVTATWFWFATAAVLVMIASFIKALFVVFNSDGIDWFAIGFFATLAILSALAVAYCRKQYAMNKKELEG